MNFWVDDYLMYNLNLDKIVVNNNEFVSNCPQF